MHKSWNYFLLLPIYRHILKETQEHQVDWFYTVTLQRDTVQWSIYIFIILCNEAFRHLRDAHQIIVNNPTEHLSCKCNLRKFPKYSRIYFIRKWFYIYNLSVNYRLLLTLHIIQYKDEHKSNIFIMLSEFEIRSSLIFRKLRN